MERGRVAGGEPVPEAGGHREGLLALCLLSCQGGSAWSAHFPEQDLSAVSLLTPPSTLEGWPSTQAPCPSRQGASGSFPGELSHPRGRWALTWGHGSGHGDCCPNQPSGGSAPTISAPHLCCAWVATAACYLCSHWHRHVPGPVLRVGASWGSPARPPQLCGPGSRSGPQLRVRLHPSASGGSW